MARPRIPIDLADVERLAARGLSRRAICNAVGVSEDTLERRVRQDDAFRAALAAGRALGLSAVANALYEKALGGNVQAQMFCLRSRGGWDAPKLRNNTLPNHDGERDAGAVGWTPRLIQTVLNHALGKAR